MRLKNVDQGDVAPVVGIGDAGEKDFRFGGFVSKDMQPIEPAVLGGCVCGYVLRLEKDRAEELRQFFPGGGIVEDRFHIPSNLPLRSLKSKPGLEEGETP